MKIIKIIISSIMMLVIFRATLISQSRFMPWNPDVAIADENIIIKNKPDDKITNVFSAPQGGAYFMIRAYQIFISPQKGPSCRFRPTCSAYGRLAVLRYGAVMGSFLAGDRLLRCNPYNAPGDDPVTGSIFK